MRRIMDEGHEVAAHGCDHWQPQASDVSRSKEILERLTGRTIEGYRQPRMFPVSDTELERMGYVYNSSLNPAFIPGRYMHLSEPRTCFMTGKLLQIPASVTPWIRFPLFWLSCHNLPMWLYQSLVNRVLKHDGYFVTYFHHGSSIRWVNTLNLKCLYHPQPFRQRNGGTFGYAYPQPERKRLSFMTYSEFAQIKLAELNKPDEK